MPLQSLKKKKPRIKISMDSGDGDKLKKKKKRGRPSLKQEVSDDDADEADVMDTPIPKKKRRKC